MERSATAPPIERRHAARRPRKVAAFIRPWDAPMGERRRGWIQDETREGIRLHASGPVRKGEEVVVYAAGRPQPLNARVVWTHLEDREFTAGCRLEPLLQDRRVPPTPARAPSGLDGRLLAILWFGGVAALLLYALLFASLRAF